MDKKMEQELVEDVNVNKNIEMPEAQVLMDYCKRRVRKRLGVNILFTGDLGKGKSYGGLRLLELWYLFFFNEEFPVKHICKTIEDAILLVRNFTRDGEGILVEELSILAGSRDSLSKTNKLWNQFLDIVRLKKVIIIGNAPRLGFIDKHMIMLAQVWLQSQGINFKEKKSRCKILAFQSSEYKTYTHHFFYRNNPIDGFILNIPSERIVTFYDNFKLQSHNAYCDEILRKLEEDREKQRMKRLKTESKKKLTEKEQEAYNYFLKKVPPKEAYIKMGYKDVTIYLHMLRKAKDKMLSNEELKNSNKNNSKMYYTTSI